MLRDCEEASSFWNRVFNHDSWSKFFSPSLLPWSEWNLSSDGIGKFPWSWFTFFSVSVVSLWRDRNCLVFSHESKMGNELWHMLTSRASDIENELSHPPTFLDDKKVSAQVGWQPPPMYFFKVNIDGAHNKHTGKSSCGGINRDSNGCFVQGFFCNLGPCDTLMDEMCALLHGTKVARGLALKKVIVESYSFVVVNIVSRGSTSNPHLEELIAVFRLDDWQM